MKRGTCAVMLLTVLVAGCGTQSYTAVDKRASTNDVGWKTAEVSVPVGPKAAVYDEGTDSLLIVARQVTAKPETVSLYRFEIATSKLTETVLGDAKGYVRPAIAHGEDGSIWVAWGHALRHISGNDIDSWAIPDPAKTAIEKTQEPEIATDAISLAIAPSGDVWVAEIGVRTAMIFSPAAQEWSNSKSLGVVPHSLSDLVIEPDGTVNVTGEDVPGEDSSSVARLTSTDDAGTVFGKALHLALTESGGVVGLDKGTVSVYESGKLASQPVVGTASVPGNSGLTVIGDDVWFWSDSTDGILLNRALLKGGDTRQYKVPLTEPHKVQGPISRGGHLSGDALHWNPNIQSIVADAHGQIWLLALSAPAASPLASELMTLKS
ncbi:MAG: hypothetical protein QOG53_3511 [Frankiales bacterium]|jgi:hypothetical protein|nr:hypothetical protein [Frankiales bacterium]